jgi:hypothetical protein
VTTRNLTVGEIIEYPSFAAGGYSPAEVIAYAPDDEQRPPAADPLVYIRTVNPPRCKPFLMRESEVRRKPQEGLPALPDPHVTANGGAAAKAGWDLAAESWFDADPF